MNKILLTCLLMYAYTQASAQVLMPDSLRNTEIEALINDIVEQKLDSIKKASKKKKKKASPFALGLDISGNISEGNVSRRLLRFEGELDYKTNTSLFEYYISPQYTYGTQNDILREDEFITRFGLNIFHSRRVYILTFGTFQTSHLRRISLRSENGLGVGFRFFKKQANTNFSITNALIYDRTDFLDRENDDIETLAFSVRLKGLYKVWKSRLIVSHTFFVQPSLLRGYFRFIGNLRFAYRHSDKLNFHLTFNDTYESIVAEDRVNNDFNILIGLSFRPFRN